jgi:hypothetical protein
MRDGEEEERGMEGKGKEKEGEEGKGKEKEGDEGKGKEKEGEEGKGKGKEPEGKGKGKEKEGDEGKGKEPDEGKGKGKELEEGKGKGRDKEGSRGSRGSKDSGSRGSRDSIEGAGKRESMRKSRRERRRTQDDDKWKDEEERRGSERVMTPIQEHEGEEGGGKKEAGEDLGTSPKKERRKDGRGSVGLSPGREKQGSAEQSPSAARSFKRATTPKGGGEGKEEVRGRQQAERGEEEGEGEEEERRGGMKGRSKSSVRRLFKPKKEEGGEGSKGSSVDTQEGGGEAGEETTQDFLRGRRTPSVPKLENMPSGSPAAGVRTPITPMTQSAGSGTTLTTPTRSHSHALSTWRGLAGLTGGYPSPEAEAGGADAEVPEGKLKLILFSNCIFIVGLGKDQRKTKEEKGGSKEDGEENEEGGQKDKEKGKETEREKGKETERGERGLDKDKDEYDELNKNLKLWKIYQWKYSLQINGNIFGENVKPADSVFPILFQIFRTFWLPFQQPQFFFP